MEFCGGDLGSRTLLGLYTRVRSLCTIMFVKMKSGMTLPAMIYSE